jgi:outer membrane protein
MMFRSETRQQFLAVFAGWLCLLPCVSAQGPEQVVVPSRSSILIRPYEPPTLPPIRTENSQLLQSLIRAGKLYLTVQDTIAAAVENNLDLEVDRYGPTNAFWNLKRQRGGGALPGVPSGNTVANQATSGQGVAGSQLAAGVSSGGGGGTGGGGSQTISQIGPITPNLDPVFQTTDLYSHQTSPQANTVQSQTPALIDTRHIYNNLVQQGLLSGGVVQITGNESYLAENSPSNNLNPSLAPVAQIYIRHQFLNSFGVGVNSRFIRVAEKNIGAARETFRLQLLNLVSNVVNQYWDLVTSTDELEVRRRALEVAQTFQNDTMEQVRRGYVARSDLYRSEAQLSTRKQELAIAQATVRQQENILKNTISRNGLADPLIASADVVLLDRIRVPEQDELPPLRTLLAKALATRPDVAAANISDETQLISAEGTRNAILPYLQGIASTSHQGLSGVPVPGQPSDPYYEGGLGTALGQIFRRNFYTTRAQIAFQGIFGNRISQGDYGIDQLQLRQGELVKRRNLNQIVVDISFQMTALRQSHGRYTVAVDGRKLQEQLLATERAKFTYGISKVVDVVDAQSAVVAAQLAELNALAAYNRARIALEQVLGDTLTTYHVSLDDALAGKVSRSVHSAVPNR